MGIGILDTLTIASCTSLTLQFIDPVSIPNASKCAVLSFLCTWEAVLSHTHCPLKHFAYGYEREILLTSVSVVEKSLWQCSTC